MRTCRTKNLPRIAKYAIAAMLVADGAGIYLAHNRLNVVPPTMAEIEAPAIAAATPGQDNASGGLQAPYSDGGGVAAAAPAVRPFNVLPPMIAYKPIELAAIDVVTPALRVAEAEAAAAAVRRAYVPRARIAALRPVRSESRVFSTAFARDIDGAAQADSTLPDVDFAQVRAVREAVQPSAAAYGESVPEVSLSSEMPSPELPAAPVAVQSDKADAPVNSVPAPEFGGEGELPAS